MPTEIVVYSCNHCGRRYDDVRQAAECEQRHLTAQGNSTTARPKHRIVQRKRNSGHPERSDSRICLSSCGYRRCLMVEEFKATPVWPYPRKDTAARV